ncbi:alpha/beta hydrolase [Streptomyces sp. HNM0645]|uniref:alpha/beta hydrolase n=1 Tax=Streptomyces sp. HNM0645 TaxID=2782343 RepID=UPI0024B718F3|nr:alpha/beta hydrolase [Streptomyces sp. HNM0645]MDI9885858.1 alpha/beta hydrolase [Streptomyces sp. HNM0645]
MRRFRRTLVAAAVATAVVTGTAGWVSGTARTPVTGPPPGTAEWRADRSLGRALPDPGSATPREVALFFAGLTETQKQRLVERHPLVVGNLDGAPVPLRYRANALALGAGTDGRQILAYDPRGRGQLAEVFGDLPGARRVAVVVPGSDIDAGTFDRTREMARSLYEAANDSDGDAAGNVPPHGATGSGGTDDRAGNEGVGSEGAGNERAGSVAVIAWAGYTTPVGVGLDAATGDLAEAGAERLAGFTRGIAAAGTVRPALFCHSYGSVVCGLAAERAGATDVVVLGSPGMRAGSVADLHTGARVWAAKAPSDWISKVPNVAFAGLGHGTDPTAPEFGARRVPADDTPGHAGYFAPGTSSLRAFASIARGEAR